MALQFKCDDLEDLPPPVSSVGARNTGLKSSKEEEETKRDDDPKAKRVQRLMDFYTAAAAAGLIKIDPSSLATSLQESKLITDEIFKPSFILLECPICSGSCLPPVFGCSNAHILCQDCQESHQEACAQLPPETPPPRLTCPTCRDPFYPIPMPVASRVLQLFLDHAPPMTPTKTE